MPSASVVKLGGVPLAVAPWIVSEELWKRFEPLLPKKGRRFRYPGRKRLDDRLALQGICSCCTPGSTGLGTVSAPLFRMHVAGVGDRARPLDLTGSAQLAQKQRVQSLPDARLLPVVQAAIASRAGAEADLTRQVPPRRRCAAALATPAAGPSGSRPTAATTTTSTGSSSVATGPHRRSPVARLSTAPA
jgi:hypothetical protein